MKLTAALEATIKRRLASRIVRRRAVRTFFALRLLPAVMTVLFTGSSFFWKMPPGVTPWLAWLLRIASAVLALVNLGYTTFKARLRWRQLDRAH